MAGHTRRHRSRKRSKKKEESLIWILTTAAVSLSILVIFLTSVNVEPGTHDVRLDRCRSSCDELMVSTAHHSGVSSPASTTALASSAVDALLLLKDSDEVVPDSENDDRPNDDGRKSHRPKRHGSKGNINMNDQFGPELGSRPPRLPPLIETLIGTVDENYYHSRHFEAGQELNKRKKTSVVRIEFSEGSGTSRSESSTSVPQRDGVYNSGDDAVAMAAAAAAAAVWSDTNKGAGKNRMKTVNEEWDASLRWIAGWGQQQGYEYSVGLNEKKNKKRSGRRRKRARDQRRKASFDARYASAGGDYDDGEDEYSVLWDSCVEECLSGASGREDGIDEEEGILSRALGGRGIIQFTADAVLTVLSSWLMQARGSKRTDSFSSDRWLVSHPHNRMVVTGLLQIVFSSIVICCVRSLWQWWSVTGHTSTSSYFDHTPNWVLEEEEELKGNGRNKATCESKSKKKASSSKKGRRRRNHNHVQQNHTATSLRVQSERSSNSVPSTSSITVKTDGVFLDEPKSDVKPVYGSVGRDKGVSTGSFQSCRKRKTNDAAPDRGQSVASSSSLHFVGKPERTESFRDEHTDIGNLRENRIRGKQTTDTHLNDATVYSEDTSAVDESTSNVEALDYDTPLLNHRHVPASSESTASSSVTLSPIGSQSVQGSDILPSFNLFSPGVVFTNASQLTLSSSEMADCPFDVTRGAVTAKHMCATGSKEPHSCQELHSCPARSSELRLSHSVNRTCSDFICANTKAVPTDEQREEASRRLRVYQAMQLQKILQRRRQISTKTKVGGLSPVAAPSSMQDTPLIPEPPLYSAVVPVSGPRTLHESSTSPIKPPPGIVLSCSSTGVMSDCVGGHHESNEMDADDDDFPADELLLSDMLEEDDEDYAVERQVTEDQSKANYSPLLSPLFSGCPSNLVSVGTDLFASLEERTRAGGAGPWGNLPLRMSLDHAGGGGQAVNIDRTLHAGTNFRGMQQPKDVRTQDDSSYFDTAATALTSSWGCSAIAQNGPSERRDNW